MLPILILLSTYLKFRNTQLENFSVVRILYQNNREIKNKNSQDFHGKFLFDIKRKLQWTEFESPFVHKDTSLAPRIFTAIVVFSM